MPSTRELKKLKISLADDIEVLLPPIRGKAEMDEGVQAHCIFDHPHPASPLQGEEMLRLRLLLVRKYVPHNEIHSTKSCVLRLET